MRQDATLKIFAVTLLSKSLGSASQRQKWPFWRSEARPLARHVLAGNSPQMMRLREWNPSFFFFFGVVSCFDSLLATKGSPKNASVKKKESYQKDSMLSETRAAHQQRPGLIEEMYILW